MAKSKQLSDVFVSVVMNSTDRIDSLIDDVRLVHGHLVGLYKNFEIIAVVDHIESEVGNVRSLLSELHGIRIVMLARHYDADTAIYAGIESSIGDYVCVYNPHFHPLEMIESLAEKNRTTDIVIGASTGRLRRKQVSNLTSRIYHNYNKKVLGIDVSPTETYLMSLSRRVVNAVTRNGGTVRNLRHLISTVGYKKVSIPYKPKNENELDRGESFVKSVVRAFSTAASFSTHPLRFVTWVGVGAALLNLLYAAYVVIANFALGRTAEGWTTLSLQASVMFFFIFVILTVISEYIGVITEEVRAGNSSYLIADELVSTITIADVDRRNITK